MNRVIACRLNGQSAISLTLSNGLEIELQSQALLAEARAIELAKSGRFAIYVDQEQIAYYLACLEYSKVFDSLCFCPRVLMSLPEKLVKQMYFSIESCLAIESEPAVLEQHYLLVVLKQHITRGVFTVAALNKIYTAIGGRKHSLLVLVASLFKQRRIRLIATELWRVPIDVCSKTQQKQLYRHCGCDGADDFLLDPNSVVSSLRDSLIEQAIFWVRKRKVLRL